jgi:hypothetical protein
MAFITIRYDEGNKNDLKYESVEIHYGEQIKNFNTGNFVKDWFDCKKFFINEIDFDYLTQSSTIDHFIMDGAPYDSAFLHFIDDKPVLKYIDYGDDDHIFSQSEICDGIELFVPEGTKPTWEELKEMCK